MAGTLYYTRAGPLPHNPCSKRESEQLCRAYFCVLRTNGTAPCRVRSSPWRSRPTLTLGRVVAMSHRRLLHLLLLLQPAEAAGAILSIHFQGLVGQVLIAAMDQGRRMILGEMDLKFQLLGGLRAGPLGVGFQEVGQMHLEEMEQWRQMRLWQMDHQRQLQVGVLLGSRLHPALKLRRLLLGCRPHPALWLVGALVFLEDLLL